MFCLRRYIKKLVVGVFGAGINSEINKLKQLLRVGGPSINTCSKGNQIIFVLFGTYCN